MPGATVWRTPDGRVEDRVSRNRTPRLIGEMAGVGDDPPQPDPPATPPKDDPPKDDPPAGGDEAKPIRLVATVTGEMKSGEIEAGAWANLPALKAGDTDPLEVVVAVPAGKSKRGWNYKPRALKRIVDAVNEHGLPGYLGHMTDEEANFRFPDVVTHWVGAKMRGETAYFRGVVDQDAKKVKRGLRAGTLRTTSIFGGPVLQTVRGEIEVIDYEPVSIDWTPPGRAGMPTQLVELRGEMDAIEGTDDHAGGVGTPSGDDSTHNTRGGGGMTLEELLAQMRAMKATPAQVVGEMQWAAADVLAATRLDLDAAARSLDPTRWETLAKEHGAIGEMAGALGADATQPDAVLAKVKGEMATALAYAALVPALGLEAGSDPEAVATRVKALVVAEKEARSQRRAALVEKVVGEMVAAPAVPLVTQLLEPRLDIDPDEEAVRNAVGEIRENPAIKTLLDSHFSSVPINPKTGGGGGNDDVKTPDSAFLRPALGRI